MIDALFVIVAIAGVLLAGWGGLRMSLVHFTHGRSYGEGRYGEGSHGDSPGERGWLEPVADKILPPDGQLTLTDKRRDTQLLLVGLLVTVGGIVLSVL